MSIQFLVTGSINMDLVVATDHLPITGETTTALQFSTLFGGKGANQAVALGRLRGENGPSIYMAGKIGPDDWGIQCKKNLIEQGIDCSYVGISQASTGIALIEVDSTGNNRIIVVPGANQTMDTTWTKPCLDTLLTEQPMIALFQFEVPRETVAYCAQRIHKAGGIVIVDPAPPDTIGDQWATSIDYLTPNQRETEALTGHYPDSPEAVDRAARVLLSKGIKNVIIKAGASGAWLITHDYTLYCPAFPVSVVDTTAAGDSFNAGFAWALGEHKSLPEALRYACAVGSLSTTSMGAQKAMPDANSVEALLQAWPKIASRQL